MPSKIEETMLALPLPEVMEDNGRHIYGEAQAYQIANEVVKVEYPDEGGILVWRKGDRFPSKGLPFHEAVTASDVAKRAALNVARFLTSKPVRYFLPLAVLLPGFVRRRILMSAITQYADLTWTIAYRSSAVLLPNRWCRMVREVVRVGSQMAGADESLQKFLKTLAVVLEYDDAYRYRVQDLFGEINIAAMLQNPGRELERIMRIGMARGEGTAPQFALLAKVIRPLMWLPEFRNPVIEFFRKVDLKELVLDEADYYKCLVWGGYNFGGFTDQQRASARVMFDETWQHHERVIKPTTT